MNPELVLVVGDMFVPQRSPDIDEQFKSILIPNKLQHVLSLGNIGSRESYDWLKSLSNDFHTVKGDYDEDTNIPEKKVVQIGEFKIGMIHGHQVLPWGDIDALTNVQRELGCDILLPRSYRRRAGFGSPLSSSFLFSAAPRRSACLLPL